MEGGYHKTEQLRSCHKLHTPVDNVMHFCGIPLAP